MRQTSFGTAYSDIYDSLYHDKSYSHECDLIEQFFKKFHNAGKIRDILDIGCGTGGHAFELNDRGYSCTGIDLSRDMIEIARAKSGERGLANPPVFYEGDARTFKIEKKFDAAIMMFAVLGYQTTNEDVKAALETVRNHLNPGGVFIFDVWFGPVVLMQRPSERVKVIKSNENQIIRAAQSKLNLLEQTCEVNYQIWKINGDKLISNTSETHRMRYFFARELDLFLETAGLHLETLEDIGRFGESPNENSWNVIGAARLI